ncbi:MAG TPA: hypothetical protein VFO10_18035 [Oligoflexus sp.]|uniref:hypothetical protein n=1 Tax=Oligoflexus sp. TaxID=1971216 RepID=UPI002D7E4E00|nr:hypothetical protein [Oligoflexus sp.]HET9239165.1 hypothetical protein [Oligoflexus sp.]
MIETIKAAIRSFILHISYRSNFQSIPRNVKRNYDQRVCGQKQKIAKTRIGKVLPDLILDKVARNIAYRKVVLRHLQQQLPGNNETHLLATPITVKAAEAYKKEKLILIGLELIIYLFIAAVSTFALGKTLSNIVPGNWPVIPNTNLKWSIIPGCIITVLAEIAALWIFDIGLNKTLIAFTNHKLFKPLITGLFLIGVSVSVPIFGIRTTHNYTSLNAADIQQKNADEEANWNAQHDTWKQEQNEAKRRKQAAEDQIPGLNESYLAERWPTVDIKDRQGCEDNKPLPGFTCPEPKAGKRVTKAFGLLQTQRNIVERAEQVLAKEEPKKPAGEAIPNTKATDNLYLLWIGIVIAKLTRLIGLRLADS